MIERFWRLAAVGLLGLCAGTANAGYLDENPDEVFESVYARLGPLPVKAARDPGVWVSLQELKREPCDQTAIDSMAQTLEKLGYRREAATGLYKFVKACGAPPIALHKSINILQKLSDHAMAVEVADEFVKRWPSNHDAHYLRGTALAAANYHERALADFANAIELYPRDKKTITSTAFLRMAESYAALARYCEAATPILTWVALDPVTRYNSRSQKIISDYEQRGNCTVAKEGHTEKYPVGRNQLVIVKAEINGVRGTFVVDTGASFVSVKSSFAERAKIPQTGTTEINLATANGAAKGTLSKADKILLGKLETTNVPVVVQKTDEKNYGLGVDGLLGMSFLSRFEIKLAGGYIEIRSRRPK